MRGSGVPNRVLMIRTDKVGDLLLTMPAIRAVRRAFPSAHLTVLASPYNAPVLRGWRVPDRVEFYDPAWPFGRRWRVAQDLRREGFDLCLVLHSSLEAYVVARLTGAPARAGVVIARRVIDRLCAPALLTDRWLSRIEAAASHGLPVLHEVEMTRHVLGCVGIPWAGDELEVPLEPEASGWVETLISRHLPPPAPLVGLHLSPKWLDHGWSIDQLGALVTMIVSRRPEIRVLLTHGSVDAEVAARLGAVAGLGASSGPGSSDDVAIGWEGRAALVRVDFPRWAAILARCRVVLTPDSGALHLAAALGRPVVGVYAAYRFAIASQQFAPWRVPNRVLRAGPFDNVAPAIVRALADLLDQECTRASPSACSS